MGEVLELRRPGMFRAALFSPCRKYRYTLTRVWDEDRPRVAFILLNPSTADETKEDPTIRRCIAYAKRWSYGGLEILNLFAWRSTNPSVLEQIPDPVGPSNLHYIQTVTAQTPLIVVGWGGRVPRAFRAQPEVVVERLKSWGKATYALKVNGDGAPGHPLYLRGELELVRFA
jgi:hypothetical protein